MELTHEIVAEQLVAPLWRGIPNDYKSKYIRNIWEQFENALKSAAYTARTSDFLSKITNRLRVGFAGAKDLKSVTAIISDLSHEKQLLKMLRDDATLLVLLVRVANEEKRELFLKQQGESNADTNL